MYKLAKITAWQEISCVANKSAVQKKKNTELSFSWKSEHFVQIAAVREKMRVVQDFNNRWRHTQNLYLLDISVFSYLVVIKKYTRTIQ